MLQLTYSGVRTRKWKCLASLPTPLAATTPEGLELAFPDCAEPDLRYRLLLGWEVLDKLFALRYNYEVAETTKGETTNV